MTDADNVYENHREDATEAQGEAHGEADGQNHAEAHDVKHGAAHDGVDEPSGAQPAEREAGRQIAVPENVQHIVDALDDKRAKDIVVLNLHDVSSSLDWFVIATGESSLQLRALETGVREDLRDLGMRPRSVEGPSDRWILLDYGGIITHLMSPDARSFYDLEGLWADADRVQVTPS